MATSASSTRHFSHMPGAFAEGAPLQNTTRYLCAAAYLNQPFARRVIREFVEEDHRGVVPSFGFDVAPVVAHCLRARRMRLIRDAVITVLLLLGLVLSPGGVFVMIILALLLWFGMLVLWSRIIPKERLATAYSVFYLMGFAAVALAGPDLLSSTNSATGQGFGDAGFGGDPGYGRSSSAGTLFLVDLLMLAALAAVPLIYRFTVYRTLQSLGPGSAVATPQAVSHRVRRTLDRVASAQRGNVTLYSNENPFLGAGEINEKWTRAWSIAVELDRPGGSLDMLASTAPPRPVDPVGLHRHVHARLVAMRDELPEHERIGGLLVDWHVVAEGECTQGDRPVDATGGTHYRGHPLVDADRCVPYSQAGPDAIAAIIRHPQANIRCYQRVTVGTQGQVIRSPEGTTIAPAEDQDTLLSTFLYLAVEGRMLYAQFVANRLPPVRRRFQIVDQLRTYTDPMIVARVLREGTVEALPEGFLAPVNLVKTGWRMMLEGLGYASGRAPTAFFSYDYGARISIRELAAERDFRTFMQTLDADKYMSLIERRINEAVLDHLQQCGVDTTAYRAQASVVLNGNPFIMTGGSISGSQIATGGAGARIDQQQSASGTPGRGS